MIDRVTLGAIPDKPHTVFRAPDGGLVYEEMLTRQGFGDAFSYLYHRHPTTAHVDVETTSRGAPIALPVDASSEPLKRRLYVGGRVAPGGEPWEARTPVLTNADLTIWLLRPTESDSVYFSNGDGDELFFVHEGEGELESVCGILPFRAGDYVVVPKGIVHRWKVEKPVYAIAFEAKRGVRLPEQYRNPLGQITMDAPYTHRDFVRPKAPIATWDGAPGGPRELVVRRHGRHTRVRLEHTPMDVVGWDGFVYPFAFPIEKFQPKTGSVHLPPTVHATFAGPGFLVCSFVPRVTDTHPLAIPCPYPHSSVDCDEVIFYVRGNFTSRRGVGPGCVSLHPAGIAHGPHPGAYEGSIGSTRTDEVAVMVDTFLPLLPTTAAAAIEDPGYHASWRLSRSGP